MGLLHNEVPPLISIIVPVYGVEDYLDECVKSLVEQSYFNLQIILVDDGSLDCCPQMCDAWSERDARIEVVHRCNGGLAAARNSGLDRVRGEYVLFVDSDDWIEPSMVDFLYREINKSDADLSIIGARYEYEDGHYFSPYKEGVRMTMSASEAFKYINLPGYFGVGVWDKLYPVQIIKGMRFAEDVRRCEDYRFTYEVLRRCQRVRFCSNQLYHYRQRAGSLSNESAYVSFEPVDATRGMLETVRKLYPEQEKYALFGYLSNAIAAFGLASRAYGRELPEEWKRLGIEIRSVARRQVSKILGIEIPYSRKMQVLLFAFSPALYLVVLESIRRVHRDRLG